MQTYNIGRNATNQIILNDEMVSRQHAQLVVFDNGQVMIRDLGSSNGTYVNGNRVTECYLKPGDIVKCASTFLKWSQYIAANSMSPLQGAAPSDINQERGENFNINPDMSVENEEINLKRVFRYLSTRIFNIGDLISRSWNSTPTILFLFLLPFSIVLIFSLIFYGVTQIHFFDQVILPLIFMILFYGVSQFLTVSLLSLGRKTSMSNTLLISSLFSFLQFSILIVMVISWLFAFLIVGNGPGFDLVRSIGNTVFNSWSVLIIAVISGAVVISILITTIIMLYKFYCTMGVKNGLSIHYTILTYAINAIIRIIFMAFLSLIAIRSLPFMEWFK